MASSAFEPEDIRKWLEMPLNRPQQSRSTLPSDATIPATLDHLIEAAKSEVYTPRHGETRPKSGLIQKEDADGAV